MSDLVERLARATKACTDEFDRPVHFYIDPEAWCRWDKEHGDKDDSPPPGMDMELESYKIIARAVLAELERTHRVVPLDATDEMRAEANFIRISGLTWSVHDLYTAMLSAAPKVE